MSNYSLEVHQYIFHRYNMDYFHIHSHQPRIFHQYIQQDINTAVDDIEQRKRHCFHKMSCHIQLK